MLESIFFNHPLPNMSIKRDEYLGMYLAVGNMINQTEHVWSLNSTELLGNPRFMCRQKIKRKIRD